MQETLDEAIDRVASTLTTVAADPGFADRLDARLDERRLRAPMWLTAAAATSLLLAMVLMNRPWGLQLWDVQRPTIEAPSKATTATLASPSPTSEASVLIAPRTSTPAGTTRNASRELEMPPAPTIAALTGPPTLSVDELRLESLTVAPVDVVHLEAVVSLELPALEITTPGEYR
jgi:hypothetical protein